MKKKANKHGFTIVELVIVIAVIAILAAVLIPTFINLTKSADSTTALADARNYAQQLLPELIDCVNEAGDLLIIQQKGDAFYVHAYLVEDGRMLNYKENPVPKSNLDENKAQNYYCNNGYDELGAYASALLDYLVEQNVIFKAMTDNSEGEWWDSDEMAELCEALGFATENTRVRADYKVIDGVFEQPEVSLTNPDGTPHTCTADTLTYHAGQTKTCVKNGWSAYYVCACGKMYSDTSLTSLNKIQITTADGHKDYNTVEYISLSDNHHAHKCAVCGAGFKKEECQDLYYEREDASGYERGCICGTRTAVELNSTNTEIPATFRIAMYFNLLLAQDAKNTTNNDHLRDGKHPTMYDAFCAVQEKGGYNSISDTTQQNSVCTVIQGAEQKDGGKKYIVWDQTIDRFVVLKKVQGKYAVDYHLEFYPNIDGYWVFNEKKDETGYSVGEAYAYLFWRTFSELPKSGSKLNAHFSIYLRGNTEFVSNVGNDNVATYNVGLDMGERTFSGKQVSSGDDVDANTLAFQIPQNKGDFIIRTVENVKISVKADVWKEKYTVKHYGKLAELCFLSQENGKKLEYHEYGTVETVTAGNGVTSSNTTLIAENGSKFKQTEADIRGLNFTFEDKGASFGYNP